MRLRNKLAKFLLCVSIGLAAGLSSAQVPSVCTGTIVNPVSDVDWNNIFPITVAGMVMTSNGNSVSPLMAAMPPVCVCPTIVFGIPFVGIGVTYWQPIYMSEIERRPGCLSSIGGVNVLGTAFSSLGSEQAQMGGAAGSPGGEASSRMQVHWYEYPLFSIIKTFNSLACKNNAGFNLAYMTEIDPLWQDDLWGAVFAPESALFASPPAELACAVDAAAAVAGYPLDPLFWCAGTWGNLYPLTGNSSHSGDPFTMNNQIQAKFIARNARMGLGWQTTGPTAICSSHPNPVWVKSEYRYDQVRPIPRFGRAVTTGDSGKLFQFPPVTNMPTQEHTINMIWKGQQCCVKPIP